MTDCSRTGPAVAHPVTERGVTVRPTRRQLLAGVGAGAAATLLASCGEAPRARSGHVVATDDLSVLLPDLRPLEDLDSHAVELIGRRYRVVASSLQPTLARHLAESLGFLEADPEADGDQEVLAPEGEVFLLAELHVEGSRVLAGHLPQRDVHSDRLVLGGEAGEPWPRPMEVGGRARIALTVPEDPGPEAAMLEVTCEEISQRLSLVDGSRISSDLEHWYDSWYQAVPEQIWWERFDEVGDAGLTMAGAVRSVDVQPGLVDGTWPGPGKILLGVDLTVLPTPEGIEALYELVLLLPDGTEATRRGRTAQEALVNPDHPAAVWFEVPHDVDAVTARLTLGTRAAGGAETSLGTEDIPVRIRAVER